MQQTLRVKQDKRERQQQMRLYKIKQERMT